MLYAELDIDVAKHWNLPAPIIASMKSCDGEQISRSLYDHDYTRVIASCATAPAELSVLTDAASHAASLRRIMGKYGRAMNISEQTLSRALDIAAEAGTIAAAMRGESEPATDGHTTTIVNAAIAGSGTEAGAQPLPGQIPVAGIPDADDSRAQLVAGTQEITNSLADDYDLNHAMRIIPETIYRGGQFDHVLLFGREARGQNLYCRLGVGGDADRL